MLRLLTYNVKHMPWIARLVPHAGSPINAFERARQAAWLNHVVGVSGLAPPWDILCLQELFDNGRQAQALRALRPSWYHPNPVVGYPHAVCDIGGDWRSNSGLFVASRSRMDSHSFASFSDACGTDRLAEKGVVCTVLNTKPLLGTKLVLFSTHMQSDDAHASIRWSQLNEMKAFIAARLQAIPHSEHYAVVVCGDINVTADKQGDIANPTQEYDALMALFAGSRDLFRRAHPASTGHTWHRDNSRVPRNERSRRLDYILAIDQMQINGTLRKFRRLHAVSIAVQRFRHTLLGDLSDHYGLGAELVLAE